MMGTRKSNIIWRVLGLCLILGTALPSCGFRPLYGETREIDNPQSAPLKQFTKISIAPIPDRSGQKLRNELIDRLHGGTAVTSARYSLVSSGIAESRRSFDITETADATRRQLRLVINIRLLDHENNKTVLNRSFEAFSSYNILDSQYTTRVSRDYARDSAITDLARQIERALALHFDRQE